MSIDHRTRLQRDVRDLERDEVFDEVIPTAIATHGDLAARGVTYKNAPALGLMVDGRAVTLGVQGSTLAISAGLDGAGVVAEMEADALSDLVQDAQSTMGLAMTARVQLTAGDINTWILWEPILRALLDGRTVHESGDIDFVGLDGEPLDLDRVFTPDDDHEEIGHFLTEAGFLHIRGVFEEDEMAVVADDIDHWIERATSDDGESWWATDEDGVDQAVRVLFFYEKSEALRDLVESDRYQWIKDLTGDGHVHRGGAEGLVKPLSLIHI